MSKTVLVTGATGMQGRPIVDALLAGGFAVRALTRKTAPGLPEGVEIAKGDMDDPANLGAAFDGVDRLVLMLPLVFDDDLVRRYVGNMIAAAQAASVELVVFDTSAPVPEARVGVAAVDVKVTAAEMLAASGLPVVTVRPTIYAGNLAAPWTAPGIVNDKTIAYPLAADVRCSWITWEDAARCVAAAVSDPSLAGQSFDIGGPDALDGAALAQAFRLARGPEHHYVAVPLDAFEAGLNGALGAPVGTEIAALYRWLSGQGAAHLNVTRGGRQNGAEALGVSPVSMANWAAQVPWERIAGNTEAV
ncbi:NmrA family NAD(P)-binding protein [Marivita sp. GX14005]|uniref:SDR family oxidoreductase n=1 Tax=Marivita sp. GX14005 TaxID=2942276 RepID=UPI002018A5BA|nr:NmrA family NAD(P)-binding protein [Marivita sp. GX14005]MCL3880725.1 NmrA family NAD(P)-binding protein [Marivita sp. GX14005]